METRIGVQKGNEIREEEEKIRKEDEEESMRKNEE